MATPRTFEQRHADMRSAVQAVVDGEGLAKTAVRFGLNPSALAGACTHAGVKIASRGTGQRRPTAKMLAAADEVHAGKSVTDAARDNGVTAPGLYLRLGALAEQAASRSNAQAAE